MHMAVEHREETDQSDGGDSGRLSRNATASPRTMTDSAIPTSETGSWIPAMPRVPATTMTPTKPTGTSHKARPPSWVASTPTATIARTWSIPVIGWVKPCISPLVSPCPVWASAMVGARTKTVLSVVSTERLMSILLGKAGFITSRPAQMYDGMWSDITDVICASSDLSRRASVNGLSKIRPRAAPTPLGFFLKEVEGKARLTPLQFRRVVERPARKNTVSEAQSPFLGDFVVRDSRAEGPVDVLHFDVELDGLAVLNRRLAFADQFVVQLVLDAVLLRDLAIRADVRMRLRRPA